MKKILIISPYFPYPPRDGGKVRLFNLIKHLSKKNDVYLLAYIEQNMNIEESVNSARQFCKDVFFVVRDENKKIVADDIPRCVSFFYTQEMTDKLKEVLEFVRPDLVQLDFLIMTQYVKYIKDIPVFYTEHDLGVLDFNQSFHDRDIPDNIRVFEWKKLVEYERKIINNFNSVIVLTRRDQKLMKEFNPYVKTVVIPTGVDVSFFNPEIDLSNEQSLVFVGHYRHHPNADAIIYFVKNIYPKVLEKKPDMKLYIVGSGLTKEVQALSETGGNIVITGEVDDIRKYLKQPNIFVAPVRLGGGIKGKVLEAMAAGVPVIATHEAFDGIECKKDTDILVADDIRKFADYICLLCDDKKLYSKLSQNARIIIEKYYDWNVIADKLNLYYSEQLNLK